MREKWNKLRKSILFYTVLMAILFTLMHFFLKLFNVQFRQWVYYFIVLLSVLGIIIGTIQIIRNKSKKVKMVFVCIGVCIAIFLAFYWHMILFIIMLSYSPEHIISKDGNKYVAYVNSFLSVNVEYCDYINWFLVGNKVKIYEDYGKGGYDPFNGRHNDYKPQQYYYYDNDGNVIKTNVKSYNKETDNIQSDTITNSLKVEKTEITENDNNDVLYEKKFDNDIIIRVVHRDYVLAQRELIGIEKSTDGGKTWSEQIKTSDGVIQIHNGTKFAFINENIGFINDPGLAGTSGDNRQLLVTIDGGKNFIKANIELNDLSKNFYIDDVPYIENNILKIKVYIIENLEKKYYYLYSIDNGITWKQV